MGLRGKVLPFSWSATPFPPAGSPFAFLAGTQDQ